MAKTPSRRTGRPARAGEKATEGAGTLFWPLPTTAPRIVVVEGKKGVFVPLAGANLTEDRSVDVLVKMIELLQSALVERECEVLVLKERIAELAAPPQSPDDFSAAIQSTVDSLQNELSRLSNPIANFAVKEFKIDTRVGVRITPLGTVEYRFAGPGERVKKASQSLLSLTLVPVEKAHECDEDLLRFLAPFRPIAQIAELADKYPSAQDYLEANHVYTIGEFLRAGGRVKIQARIAAAVHVDAKTLERWLETAEMLLVKDLDYGLVVQLQRAGIHGMGGLQSADAEETVAALKRADVDIERVCRWREIAARYLESR